LVELDHIRSRCTVEVLSTWRSYQRELAAHGVTTLAEDLYSQIWTLLDRDVDDELEEVELHDLAFGRYPEGRRPALISRLSAWEPAPANILGSAPQHFQQLTEGAREPPAHPQPARPAIPTPAASDEELVSMHREAQRALALGLTHYALLTQIELERTLSRDWDIDPSNEQAREIALDVLHAAAWPDTTTRPDRLCIEGGGSPLED
jgi:hypothetical protein